MENEKIKVSNNNNANISYENDSCLLTKEMYVVFLTSQYRPQHVELIMNNV